MAKIKCKLEFDAQDAKKFTTAAEYAEVKLDVDTLKNFGSKSKVEVETNDGKNLFVMGRIMDKIITPEKEPQTENKPK